MVSLGGVGEPAAARSVGADDGVAFCRDLPQRAGVVAIPHEVFHDDPEAGKPFVRWAFCKRPEVLEEALTRLRRVFGDLAATSSLVSCA